MQRKIGFGLLIVAVWIAVVVCIHLGEDSHPAPPAVQAASVASPSPSPQRVAECRKLLKSAPAGSWRSYNAKEGYGTVVVGAVYYTAPFEGKEAMDSIFRCIMSDGRQDNVGIDYVEYLDPYTHKEIAKWSKYTGFSVD